MVAANTTAVFSHATPLSFPPNSCFLFLPTTHIFLSLHTHIFPSPIKNFLPAALRQTLYWQLTIKLFKVTKFFYPVLTNFRNSAAF